MAKGWIAFQENRCKGCELCISVCPQAVIKLEPDRTNIKGYHPAVLLDPEGRCTGCGLCAVICPDVAITVYREPRKVAA